LLLKIKLNCNPLFFFFEALEKIKPIVGLKFTKKNIKASKVLKVTAVPFLLTVELQYKQALLWLIKSTVLRVDKSLSLKLFSELYSITFFNTSLALKKKCE
jgi:ribosomal protein S7